MSTKGIMLYRKDLLENLYREKNRRHLVDPDPLLTLYDYSSLEDREIVGLISALLAFGSVKQIMRSIRLVLAEMHQPAVFRRYAPDDPVKYDFVLTRFGIHKVGGSLDFIRHFRRGA